jgi:DNA uptake protein ComE-like DNA-binding protein
MLNKLKDQLTWSHAERNGIFVLLVILAGIATRDRWYPQPQIPDPQIFVEEIRSIEVCDSLTVVQKRSKWKKSPPKNKPWSRPRIKHEYGRKSFVRKEIVVDINEADSAELIEVKGIGPVFARRITRYRDLLGGYHSVAQLIEVYGMDEDRLTDLASQLTCSKHLVERLNINEVSFGQLSKHPYIRKSLASWIIKHREQHGPFKDVAEINDSYMIEAGEFDRVSPYISVDGSR